jgi:DNA (cytosine-5)-methyltransferase 1
VRIVDLFAGAGGTSEGAKRAGMQVVWAGNHWVEACKVHERWHKGVAVCQDLQQFNWRRLPDHDILWASPACQGHSEAGQPARARDATLAAQHDDLRSTMLAVIDAVLAKMPRAFVVENVKEVAEWTTPDTTVGSFSTRSEAQALAWRLQAGAPKPGPTYVVCKRKGGNFEVVRRGEKGAVFRWWLNFFKMAGYHVTVQVVNAAKFGTPQIRQRLIVVGHLSREVSIIEPDLKPENFNTLEGILDFDGDGDTGWIDIEDIDERRKAGARARAMYAHSTFDGEPCWGWHVSHEAAWARSPRTPANTLTTQNQHYLVCGGQYRLWSVAESLQVQGLRPDYLDGVPRTAALIMAGNAVPPDLACGVLQQVARAA